MDISAFIGKVAAPAPEQTNDEIWTANLDVTTWFVYGVALLLLAAVILFIKVVFFNKRPQKLALVFVLLTVPLYLVYYDDRFRALFGEDFRARSWVRGSSSGTARRPTSTPTSTPTSRPRSWSASSC